MKKLFTILSFVLCASLSWSATTVVYSVADTATKYTWENLSVHSTLQMDANISVNATHDAAANSTNGTYSNSQWYAYQKDNDGEFSISAAEGYRIFSVGINNNAQNGAKIVNKVTRDTILDNGTAYVVNSESVAFNVVKSVETTKSINARITKFTVIYDTLPSAVAVEDMTVKVGQRFQLKANVTPATWNNQVTWATNASNIVDIDANGMIDVKAEGKATITVTTFNGKEATCTITAEAAAEDVSFAEDYANLAEQVEWKNTNTEYTGAMGQLFRVRNYRFSSATELTTGVAGVELQYSVSTKTINFIAYANAQQEGGAKAVTFQWRAVDGTKPVMFDVDSTQNKAPMNLVSLPANGGYEKVQSFAKELGFEQNMQLRIRIADAASSNIVFGPVTITPYLLYKQKMDSVVLPQTSFDCASADLLINNTKDVVYEIVSDATGAATIANGVLNLSAVAAAGDILVKASSNGGKVFTTFTLRVKEDPSTSLVETAVAPAVRKQMVNGQMIIMRGNQSFSVLGTSLSR